MIPLFEVRELMLTLFELHEVRGLIMLLFKVMGWFCHFLCWKEADAATL